MKEHPCTICGFVYDRARYDPDHGGAPRTAFADLLEDRTCPDCGPEKAMFEPA